MADTKASTKQTPLEPVGVLKQSILAIQQLLDFSNIYLSILFVSQIYLSVNPNIIGVNVELVRAYAIISVLAIVWANSKGINLDVLTWRAASPFSGKYIKTPQKLYVVLGLGAISALGTMILYAIVHPNHIPSDVSQLIRIQGTLQQLFIVVLPETVIFQGLVPIIASVLCFRKTEDLTSNQIFFTYAFSQLLFAFMHWQAYGGSLVDMIFVYCLGLVWVMLYRRFGPMLPVGSHWGWNYSVNFM